LEQGYKQLKNVVDGELVGLIMTTCNDLELAHRAYESLCASMFLEYAWAFLVVDSGSTDGTVEYFQEKMVKVFGPHIPEYYPTKHMCQALNAGIKMYLGYDPDTKEFTQRDYVNYIGWIHPDMTFPQTQWLPELVKVCKENPEYGKLSPDEWQFNLAEDRPGNGCPWIMPVSVLLELWEKDGTFLDENFKYTQNYDDWDLNRRVINMGYKVMITPRAKIKHEGMGTRKEHQDPKYRRAAYHNAAYYTKKWGDCTCPV